MDHSIETRLRAEVEEQAHRPEFVGELLAIPGPISISRNSPMIPDLE
jgi:hypothetical protein